MLIGLFQCCTQNESVSPTMQLHQAAKVLEEKEALLQKRILVEIERAKAFTKAKNKEAALQCLKRRKAYEAQRQLVGSLQSRIHEQQVMISRMLKSKN